MKSCKFIGTKETVYIRKEFNSHRISLVRQHCRRFNVFKNQYGCYDVMCIFALHAFTIGCMYLEFWSIPTYSDVVFVWGFRNSGLQWYWYISNMAHCNNGSKKGGTERDKMKTQFLFLASFLSRQQQQLQHVKSWLEKTELNDMTSYEITEPCFFRCVPL